MFQARDETQLVCRLEERTRRDCSEPCRTDSEKVCGWRSPVQLLFRGEHRVAGAGRVWQVEGS